MAELYFSVNRGGVKQQRDANGRYASGSRAELNAKLLGRAERQRDIILAALGRAARDSYVRPGESTRTLEKALTAGQGRMGSSGNAFVTPTMIGIGNPEWLDQATADRGKYWRKIEEGTTEFVGHRLVFGSKNTRGRSNEPRLRDTKNFRNGGGRSPKMVVKVPILPHHIFETVEREQRGNITRFLQQQASDYFRDLLSAE